jgi:DNA-binding NarL/FixJ family response regulator
MSMTETIEDVLGVNEEMKVQKNVQRDRDIIQLYKQGWHINEIARCLKLSKLFVSWKLFIRSILVKEIKDDYNKALNKPNNVMLLLEKGYSIDQIAKFLSISTIQIEFIKEINSIKIEELENE